MVHPLSARSMTEPAGAQGRLRRSSDRESAPDFSASAGFADRLVVVIVVSRLARQAIIAEKPHCGRQSMRRTACILFSHYLERKRLASG